eukprot:10736533-Lingulodinium_polyedra.AAC.1
MPAASAGSGPDAGAALCRHSGSATPATQGDPLGLVYDAALAQAGEGGGVSAGLDRGPDARL